MKICSVRCIVMLAILSALCAASDQPAYRTINQSAYLKISNNSGDSFFGTSVAVAGDVIVVGAENQGTDRQGAAFVFTKSGNSWKQVAELVASDRLAQEFVGYSLAITSDGNTIFAGAPELPSTKQTAGSVYVFVKPAGGWTNMTETAKLTAAHSSFLGTALSVSGDGTTLAVGSGGTSAHVFVEPTGGWANTTEATATLTDSQQGAAWRYPAISGDGSTIADGAVDGKTQNGLAFVYLRPGSQWQGTVQPTADLTPSVISSPPGYGDDFGAGIATDGNIVAIGATNQNNLQGEAYIYVKPTSGWTNMTETATIAAPQVAAPSDFFGWPVVISGTAVLVGYEAAITDENGTQDLSGEVFGYVEPKGGWVNTNIPNFSLLPNPTLKSNLVQVFLFCNGLAIDGNTNTVVVGAPGTWYKGQPQQGFPGLGFVFNLP
ncbi:MAG TPA: hypothetical protein VNY51_03000 [Candidatus Dormibacteraeota bacterium]|jgi:hypothetical protein|nr:hypothetical protein [Candidatus Dormibacteraeota bacterium]